MPVFVCKGCRKAFTSENRLILHIRNSRDSLCEHYCYESVPTLVSRASIPVSIQRPAVVVEDDSEEEQEVVEEGDWLDDEPDDAYVPIPDAPAGVNLFRQGPDNTNNANANTPETPNSDETSGGDAVDLKTCERPLIDDGHGLKPVHIF